MGTFLVVSVVGQRWCILLYRILIGLMDWIFQTEWFELNFVNYLFTNF